MSETPLTPQELDDKISDAYSRDRYRNGFIPCIKMLRKRGLSDREIEAVLRSKWTRWAADWAEGEFGYSCGYMTASAFEKYMFYAHKYGKNPNDWKVKKYIPLDKKQVQNDIDQLVIGTFGRLYEEQ
jgi:hypothetical protein